MQRSFIPFKALLALLWAMFLLPVWVYAQPWPVTVNVSVSRFSGGLEAYDDPGRVIVTLLSTDDRPEYAVQLRLRLSGEGVSVGSRPEPP